MMSSTSVCIELYNTPAEAGSSSTENLTCASEHSMMAHNKRSRCTYTYVKTGSIIGSDCDWKGARAVRKYLHEGSITDSSM
jgi:hypothetical protein